ncbi:MAG: carbohydrate ABC transporter permease [Treponema sp.]|jgi:multiple sugar transport system permease protein|nr:carbohydrate ABC transporter permease [Treponema sp.]
MKRVKYAANNGIIREFDLRQGHVRVVYALILILGIIAALIGIAPLVWVILTGFKGIREFVRSTSILPKKFDFNIYLVTWRQLRFVVYYRNSLIAVAGSVVCAVFFNGLLGYALSRIKPAGSRIVYMLVMWGLLIPAATSVVPLFINISKLRLTGNFLPLWLSIGANAFYVVLFKNFFDELPGSLIEAAKIDGGTDFLIFRKIALPLSQAIMMVVVMYAINAAWSDFLLPYLVLNGSSLETVMVRLFQFKNGKTNDADILRAIVFALAPPIVLFLVFQKQITQVTLQSGIKG